MLTISAAYGATVDAAPRPHAAVAIRTYNYAAVDIEQMSEARSEAAHIFKGAGISLEWIECRVPGRQRRCGLHRTATRRTRSHVEARRPDAVSRRARRGAGGIDARSRAARRGLDDDRHVSCSRRRGEDGHCCLDAAWPGDRTRNRAPPAGQRRASPGGSDAGAVVARGTPGTQAGSLGIFIARSGAHARNAARPSHPSHQARTRSHPVAPRPGLYSRL